MMSAKDVAQCRKIPWLAVVIAVQESQNGRNREEHRCEVMGKKARATPTTSEAIINGAEQLGLVNARVYDFCCDVILRRW